MNTLDLILLFLLAIGAFSGFRKGFILEIVGLLAFIVAIIGGFQLLDWGMDILSPYVDNIGSLLPFFTFLLIFIIILVGITLIGRFIKAALHLTPFGIADSVAGAFLGILKWAFGISVLIWITTGLGINITEHFKGGSQVYHWVTPIAPFVFEEISDFLPYIKHLILSIKDLFTQ